jgi:hypothetical protein
MGDTTQCLMTLKEDGKARSIVASNNDFLQYSKNIFNPISVLLRAEQLKKRHFQKGGR